MTPVTQRCIEIDGSGGEGGGQILRTALALALRTGTAFRLYNVRHNRAKPGLRPQHLSAVQAAAQLGAAELAGAEVDSRELWFWPQTGGHIAPGVYRFDIGTAGSAPLVLQTVLPALLAAGGASAVTIVGGTYNPKAPPYDFVAQAFAPILGRMGAKLTLELKQPGFYPAGGGELRASIEPPPQGERLARLDLLERGALRSGTGTVVLARLPSAIAAREIDVLAAALRWPRERFSVRTYDRARSPGNAVLVTLESEHVTELFSAVGERGVPAEKVAQSVADEAAAYLKLGVPVGEHLADQLLLPMALGRGGSYRTGPLSLHATTQIDIVQRFLPVKIRTKEEPGGTVRVDVEVDAPEGDAVRDKT